LVLTARLRWLKTYGTVYTRTGRAFFNDGALQEALLERVRAALDRIDFWTRFETVWVALDCELMPWSAKAQALLLDQYAPVAVASRHGRNRGILPFR
jgi:protein phosphatase